MSFLSPPSPEEQPFFSLPPAASASPSATAETTNSTGIAGSSSHLYFQQTTSSILSSTIVFIFLATTIGLALFSWVRTKRSSIYGSRQFFVREEHRADALSDSFLGWIPALFFLERNIERKLEAEATGTTTPPTTTAATTTTMTTNGQQGLAASGGGGVSGNGNRDHTTMQHSLTERDSRIEDEGRLGSGNSNSDKLGNFFNNKMPRIWSRLTELLVSDKTHAKNMIQLGANTAARTASAAETKEEVSITNEESNTTAASSTTLKSPHQKSGSTLSTSSTASSQQHLAPTTIRHTVDASAEKVLAEKASTLARQVIIAKIGLDHYLLIRFLKMLFSLSAILGVVAITVLLPLYVTHQTGEDLQLPAALPSTGSHPVLRIEMLQIGNVIDNQRLWAAVLVVAVFSGNERRS